MPILAGLRTLKKTCIQATWSHPNLSNTAAGPVALSVKL